MKKEIMKVRKIYFLAVILFLAFTIQSLNGQDSYKSETAFLPAPMITIDSVNDPSPGHIFMATWDRNVPHVYANYIFVLDKTGHIVDSLRLNGALFDFKVQPNGLLSVALGDFAGVVPLADDELRHLVLDSDLTVVDSFKMQNDYPTDFHEFLLLPNGHGMMMSYHYTKYDMSTLHPEGRPDCDLVINVIQEQDRDKNVVFEWRNIDYIPIEDTDRTVIRTLFLNGETLIIFLLRILNCLLPMLESITERSMHLKLTTMAIF